MEGSGPARGGAGHGGESGGASHGGSGGGSGSGPLHTALHANVLVLNRHYAPVHVTSARRAFVLFYKGDAEAIHLQNERIVSFDFEAWLAHSSAGPTDEDDEFVATVALKILVPRIVRLLEYSHLPIARVNFSRKNVLARDEFRCQYCGLRTSGREHARPRDPALARREALLDERRRLLQPLQRPQGSAHAPRGGHAPPPRACRAEAQPRAEAQARGAQVRDLADFYQLTRETRRELSGAARFLFRASREKFPARRARSSAGCCCESALRADSPPACGAPQTATADDEPRL
jgi:hypothetical protein